MVQSTARLLTHGTGGSRRTCRRSRPSAPPSRAPTGRWSSLPSPSALPRARRDRAGPPDIRIHPRVASAQAARRRPLPSQNDREPGRDHAVSLLASMAPGRDTSVTDGRRGSKDRVDGHPGRSTPSRRAIPLSQQRAKPPELERRSGVGRISARMCTRRRATSGPITYVIMGDQPFPSPEGYERAQPAHRRVQSAPRAKDAGAVAAG